MKYSINIDRKDLVLAQKYEINASYKQLGAVCDSIRYMRVDSAMSILDDVAELKRPVLFRKHNKAMGSRHELKGKKGRYPQKAAKEVKKVLINAIANANVKGLDGEHMFIAHACANKTHIARRYPSKGGLSWGRGMYGSSAIMHSDLEYTKIEVALATGEEENLSKKMKAMIKRRGMIVPKMKVSINKANEQKKNKETIKKNDVKV
jgi:large subunit ribosomal protein L22